MESVRKKIFHKEFVSYLFWGVTTTLFNVLVFQSLSKVIDYKIANIIAIISCKIYAYCVNKFFVFHSKCGSFRAFISEIVRYIVFRGLTGVFDFFGVILCVETFKMSENIAKYVTTFTVIILNYFFGKGLVFTKNQNDEKDKAKSDGGVI